MVHRYIFFAKTSGPPRFCSFMYYNLSPGKKKKQTRWGREEKSTAGPLYFNLHVDVYIKVVATCAFIQIDLYMTYKFYIILILYLIFLYRIFSIYFIDKSIYIYIKKIFCLFFFYVFFNAHTLRFLLTQEDRGCVWVTRDIITYDIDVVASCVTLQPFLNTCQKKTGQKWHLV